MAVGDFSEALNSINRVLELDQKNEDAYILHALLLMKNGNYATALNSLGQAISNNFVIRENPMFMLVKGEVVF
jgi:tetratricopeptide repeat protein 21B